MLTISTSRWRSLCWTILKMHKNKKSSFAPLPSMKAIQITAILLFITLSLNAQRISICAIDNQGLGYRLNDKNIFEPGFSGAGLQVNWQKNIKKTDLSLILGGEFSFAGWGSQLLFQTGIGLRIKEIGKFKLNILAITYNGMSLLKPQAQFVNALELCPEICFSLSSKIDISLSSGARYTASPAYRNFAPIWAYFDIPIKLGVCLH